MQISKLAGLGLACVVVAAGANAQDKRAVEDLNLQVTVLGGVNDDEGEAFVAAKGAFPLGDVIGVQIEAAVGNREYYGGAAHVFWRDPDVALLGAFASLETLEGIELFRVGAEAEAYLGQFTVAGRAGFQDLNEETGAFGRADLYWYPIDTLALRLGIEATPDLIFGRAAAEIQPFFEDFPGFSVFAQGEYGERDSYRALGGVRIHFGSPEFKLIERERREDPDFAILNVATLQDEFVREQARQLAEQQVGAAEIDCSDFFGDLTQVDGVDGVEGIPGWIPIDSIPEECLGVRF